MSVFNRNYDHREAETITAYLAGHKVPEALLDAARAAGAVKETKNEGPAKNRPPRTPVALKG